ncbi:MAG: hypothetical protein LUG99_23665, partial [Lachnospiraceae bacterium]|nr:hypothetical protein [Lachnospiraceae bacterium]
MRQSLIDFGQFNIRWDVGSAEEMGAMQTAPALEPFSEETVRFLSDVSKKLLSSPMAKTYPDVVTFAFWIRKASLEKMKNRFADDFLRLGRGIVFHVAPSNVPVNYAYSLVAGLITGNANVVRIPSKEFPQVDVINKAISESLDDHEEMKPYIALVRYGHDAEVSKALTSTADVRVIWGGDNTIGEFRKFPLKPRATEVTFADRYSLAVIDADVYMDMEDKKRVANDFFNDTYLTDQNACTSPRVVVWMGRRIEEAKKLFWDHLHEHLIGKYEIQGVQIVNKLTSAYLAAVCRIGSIKEKSDDNLIVRVRVNSLDAELMDLKDNSGYFFEYHCNDIMELQDICDDTRCQTVSYIGSKEIFTELIKSGIKGVDRIVPVGKTMDFDMIWDG